MVEPNLTCNLVSTLTVIQLSESSYTVVSCKRAHGRSTLQVCQRGGWAFFQLFPHLTTKECPRQVYNDSKPSKQIIAHKIMYNRITSVFEVESWQHTTLRKARCDGEHSVARGAHRITYVLLCKDALYWFWWSITRCFIPEIFIRDTHSTWGRASQTPREAVAPRWGTHSSKLWPLYKKLGQK